MEKFKVYFVKKEHLNDVLKWKRFKEEHFLEIGIFLSTSKEYIKNKFEEVVKGVSTPFTAYTRATQIENRNTFGIGDVVYDYNKNKFFLWNHAWEELEV